MTTAPTSPTDAYEEFARFYDAFTSGSDYETWTFQMLGLAGRHGLAGNRLLDVACGTGKSFLPFLQRGFEVAACDISPSMLAVAARNAPGVPLAEADMRALPKLGSFDLVTCFDDSLNHLLDEDALASAFASLADNLDTAGVLLFDLNTLLAFRTTFAFDSAAVHDTATFLTRGNSSADAPPGCLAVVDVDVYVAREDGLYERLATRLQERHFPPHRVTSLLALAGLQCLGVYGVLDDGTPVAEADESRHLKLVYAATLAKGGDSE